MGQLIISQWARLMALTSGAYVVWASLWAFWYRKFFWDMLGAELGPTGLVPNQRVKVLVHVIVDVPVVQVVNLLNGLLTLAIEWPSHQSVLAQSRLISSSLLLRIMFYLWSSACALLLYQTIDGGVMYGITTIMYAIARSKGERINVEQTGHGPRSARGGTGTGTGNQACLSQTRARTRSVPVALTRLGGGGGGGR